jgi:hypothetical protein
VRARGNGNELKTFSQTPIEVFTFSPSRETTNPIIGSFSPKMDEWLSMERALAEATEKKRAEASEKQQAETEKQQAEAKKQQADDTEKQQADARKQRADERKQRAKLAKQKKAEMEERGQWPSP